MSSKMQTLGQHESSPAIPETFCLWLLTIPEPFRWKCSFLYSIWDGQQSLWCYVLDSWLKLRWKLTNVLAAAEQSLHSIKVLSSPLLHLCAPSKKIGSVQEVGRGQSQQLTRTDQRGIPCHIMSGAAIQNEGRGFLKKVGIAQETGWGLVCLWQTASN